MKKRRKAPDLRGGAMSAREFKARLKSSAGVEGGRAGRWPARCAVLKHHSAPALKQAEEDEDARRLRFVISTGERDRDGDTVAVDGWELDNYRKNPVVLVNHGAWGPEGLPVAKSVEVAVEGGSLVSAAEFAAPEVYPLADTLYKLYLHRFMNATSIKLLPIEWEFNEDEFGVDFARHELLEWSLVSVPANPEALRDAKAAGIALEPLADYAERILDDYHGTKGIWLPRERVEKAFKIASGERKGVAVKKSKSKPRKTEKRERYLRIRLAKGEMGASALNELIDERVAEEFDEDGDETENQVRSRILDELAAAMTDADGEPLPRGTLLQIISQVTIDCPPIERLEGAAGYFDVPAETIISAFEADGCYQDEEEEEGEESEASHDPCPTCGKRAKPAPAPVNSLDELRQRQAEAEALEA